MANLSQSLSPCCKTPDTAWSMTASWHVSNHPSIGSLAEAAKVYFLIQIYLLSTQHIHTDHPGPQSIEVEYSTVRRVKDLEHVPCASEEERSAVEKAALSAQAKKLHHLGRTYRYTMNMFITAKECALSKLASCYDPVQHFESHRGEGNFRELTDWMPEEFEDDLRRWHKFFRQHIEYPTTLSKK